ncbi:MAG: hypothetical protein SWH68_02690 [Thermodesulfobacteriota bacterium]|nr:hypothetical protein [Thermodesulfobacteriota bacterium]
MQCVKVAPPGAIFIIWSTMVGGDSALSCSGLGVSSTASVGQMLTHSPQPMHRSALTRGAISASSSRSATVSSGCPRRSATAAGASRLWLMFTNMAPSASENRYLRILISMPEAVAGNPMEYISSCCCTCR